MACQQGYAYTMEYTIEFVSQAEKLECVKAGWQIWPSVTFYGAWLSARQLSLLEASVEQSKSIKKRAMGRFTPRNDLCILGPNTPTRKSEIRTRPVDLEDKFLAEGAIPKQSDGCKRLSSGLAGPYVMNGQRLVGCSTLCLVQSATYHFYLCKGLKMSTSTSHPVA